MRWQKAARVVVAVIGVGTAASLYLLTRERPAPSKPPLAGMSDPAAKMESGAGREERYEGNRLLGTLTYSEVRTYEDGRVIWQAFQYTLQDGTVLSADRAEARGRTAAGEAPDELALKGNVHLKTDDGTTLRGESGTFNDATGQANVPGRTSFSRGRMSGTGTGGIYERDTGVFRLQADASVAITPEDPAQTPLQATSSSMTFTPGGKSMLFEQDARLVRAGETLTAERATLHLTEDEERFRLIELRGGSRVTPAGPSASALPEMQADDIDLGFHEDGQALQRGGLVGGASMIQTSPQGPRAIEAGQIDFTTAADGSTVTRIATARRPGQDRVVVRTPSGTGVPSRTITAATLVATGDDTRGLTAAVFDGSVEFVEAGVARTGQSGSRRVGTSQRLALVLKGQLDAIEQARFERDVTFTSGEVVGHAEIGMYRSAAGEMDLRPGPARRRASVVDAAAGVRVEAAELITVSLDSGNLHGVGDVNTVTSRAKTPAARSSSTSIFNGTDPIYGTAAEFRYDDARAAASYLGTAAAPAQLKQGETVVRGEEIVFLRELQDLTARGGVETRFDIAAAPAGPAGGSPTSGTYRVTAESLTYTEQTRTARYTGSARLETRDGVTTARAIALVLASDTRALERLEATEQVRAVLQGGREARGDRLVHEAREDRYLLWGKPLTLITRESDGTCYGQDGSFVRFEGQLGAPDFPADQNADGGAPRRAIACPAPASK